MRDLLVTGPPRSGTLSVARAVVAMGLEVGHESMGRDGSVSCLLGFPSADAGRRDLGTHLEGGLDRFSFRTVARILRDPLDTIASLARFRTPGLWRFVERELGQVEPELKRASRIGRQGWIERAARTWLAWEQGISKTWGPFAGADRDRQDRAEIRIEKFPESLERIAGWYGQAIPPGDFHEHRSQHPRLTWRELERHTSKSLCGRILVWASEGGYL